ncbi:tRNA (5-methylaminomethyl-2-thiouridine)(34)-methyltransferase MnmD [Maribellus comscasis]|uniref:tRNA (5-methylaminomethyl-2-thiouridine)(34)-methyltransferase MnmD n=1 Tax=Maribellus comscasis TaxID=2681766 RepID=A0A6I6JJ41_9BACT|nr:tRNA (5-methylaminomethyl-2-thiouridine)(34)-methyltransferase MnmD [Maribellus comscasis]QGY42875.1 tRNA (5-methylaminomethyl-2-thiouridine)(34)-methyltransferase MnmD [Maribellus comscasis]
MKHQIIETADGSKTIYIPGIDEQYHSVNGALTESNYVYIEKGYSFCKKGSPVVFEVGFGTGLNCILTAIEAERQKKVTHYYSIDNFPLDKLTLEQLDHKSLFSEKEKAIFKKIHACEWDKLIPVSEYFYLNKIQTDIRKFNVSLLKKFDVVYFDAFGPDKQPEMWTQQIFDSIYRQCSEEAIFVTYSAKGEIRRNLAQIGYVMERLPGPPGKKQMLRGIKKD